jgi:site-specific recombinase XerD
LLRHACATHLLENRCLLDVIAAIPGMTGWTSQHIMRRSQPGS